VKSPNPIGTLDGERESTTGVGAGGTGITLNVTGADVPPPGAGVKTVTSAAPVWATSDAGIEANRLNAVSSEVGRSLPFHCTTEPDTKPVPSTLSEKPRDPTTARVGKILLIDGRG
jgi:hypothetical protein